MSDIVDKSSVLEQFHIKHALATRKPVGPDATGYCLNCGRKLEDKRRRWCDADCRDTWERNNRDA